MIENALGWLAVGWLVLGAIIGLLVSVGIADTVRERERQTSDDGQEVGR